MDLRALKNISLCPVCPPVRASGDSGACATYLDVLDEHFFTPQPREFVENLARVVVLDDAADGVVCATDPTLGFKLDIG